MTRFRVVTAAALAAGLALAAGVLAQEPPNLLPVKGQPKTLIQPKLATAQPAQPQAAGAAAELPVVPKSSAAFLSLKLSDVIDHPDLKAALEPLKKNPEALEGFTEVFGLTPHEIERITLFWPAMGRRIGAGEPVVVVTTRQPYNEVRVLKALRAEPMFDGFNRGQHFDRIPPDFGAVPKAAVKPPEFTPPVIKGPIEPPKEQEPSPEEGGETFPISTAAPEEPFAYEIRGGPFEVLFIADERTLVFMPGGHGAEFNMMALFAQMLKKKQTGPLADAIAGAGNHTLAGGVSLTPLFREFERGIPRELSPYAALVAARTGTITGDLGKSAKFTVKLTFDDANAARRAAPVLDEGLKALAEKVSEEGVRMKDSRRPGDAALAPLFAAAATGMKNAAVKADGATVVATAEIDAGPAAAKAVADLMQSVTSRKKFAARANNLKQIGLALHSYHDANGHLPRNIYGPKGEPLLSWRVHLLPYMEYDNLYRQFKMDEAWDGPNNKKLIEQMPKVYEVLGREAPRGQTFYQAFLTPSPQRPLAKGEKPFNGRSWLVEGGKDRVGLQHIPDGTSNTIGVVEARTGVIWSKPDDIPFGEKLPALGGEKDDAFMVLLLDGSVRTLSTSIKPDVLHILIDTRDGMVIPEDALDDRPRRPGGFSPPGAGGGAAKSADPPTVVKEEEQQAALADLRRMEATLAVALAALDQKKAAAELRTKEAARTAELFKQGGATRAEVEQAEAVLAETRAIVARIERDVAAFAERVQSMRREVERK